MRLLVRYFIYRQFKHLVITVPLELTIQMEFCTVLSKQQVEHTRKNCVSRGRQTSNGLSGTLAFDSKKIKEKVVFDEHTGEIVGFSQDFFEQNIIFDEIKKFSSDNGDDGDDDDAPDAASNNAALDDQEAEEGPNLIEHYLVFIFTTWEKSRRRKIQFVAARYGLKSIDTEFLYRKIEGIVEIKKC